jgi:hypothetical protein
MQDLSETRAPSEGEEIVIVRAIDMLTHCVGDMDDVFTEGEYDLLMQAILVLQKTVEDNNATER